MSTRTHDSACFEFFDGKVCDIECPYYDSLWGCPNQKAIYRRKRKMDRAKTFYERKGSHVEEHQQGLLIDDLYIYSLKTNKWRVKGKKVWYRSNGYKDLYDRFINKGK